MEDPDRKIMNEELERKLSPYPKLLMGLGSRRDVCIDWSCKNVIAYEEAYFQAARILIEHFRQHPPLDFEALPVVFLFRHYVELAIKDCLLHSLVLAKLNDRDFPDAEFLKTLRERHELSKLLSNLEKLHKQMADFGFLSRQSVQFISELDRADPRSYTFRYPTDTKGQEVLPDRLDFNLDALQVGMEHVKRELDLLRDLTAITADQLQDYLADLESEIG